MLKSITHYLAGAFVCSAFAVPSTADACVCYAVYGIDWCLYDGTTTVVSTPYYDLVAHDHRGNGSCQPGQNPPTQVCSAQVTNEVVTEASLTGSMDFSDFGVPVEIEAKIGETKTVSASCGGSTTVDSWCQCCSSKARLKYTIYTATYTCACSGVGGANCSRSYSGTLKVYENVDCISDNDCVIPDDPCETNCTGA